MKKYYWFIGMLILLLGVTGCVATKANLKENTGLKKVAVVSLAVSDWGGTVDSGSVGGTSVGTLMQGGTGEMLDHIEKLLAERWQVKKAKTFVATAGYRKAAEDIHVDVYSPRFKKKEMVLFGTGFKKGNITPEKARELCRMLKVDAVVLVFSEWTQATGGFVPITRAKTKNVVSFWDKNGEKIYYRRIDMNGEHVLGGFGIKAVTHDTIDEWINSYALSLNKMFKSI